MDRLQAQLTRLVEEHVLTAAQAPELADAARAQIHDIGESVLEITLRHLSGVVEADIDR